jgi:hypothetical protein
VNSTVSQLTLAETGRLAGRWGVYYRKDGHPATKAFSSNTP